MGLSYTDKLGGMLAFYTTPADEKMNIDELETFVEDTIKEGLAALKAEKITQIKNQQLATTVYLEENPNSAARFVGGMLMEGYQPDEIENFDELILSITKDDVLAAWKKVMQATVRVQGMLIKENAGE
jgi:predicted Zn-dependent peptidase